MEAFEEIPLAGNKAQAAPPVCVGGELLCVCKGGLLCVGGINF